MMVRSYLQSNILITLAQELFSFVILYYQFQSVHNFICIDSPIFHESDSGRFSFANQEVIILTL